MTEEEREIISAIENSYRDYYRFDGHIVINKLGTIQFSDFGARNIFKSDELEGSNIFHLLPDYIKERHPRLVEGEFARLHEALTQSDDKDAYQGRIMGAAPTERTARLFPAFTVGKEQIQIGIEFQPLIVSKDKIYMVAFLTAGAPIPHTISQSAQAVAVVENARLALGFQVADQAGNRFHRAHVWLIKNVYRGIPGARILALLTEIALIAGIILGGITVYESIRGQKSFQQFNISVPPGTLIPSDGSSATNNSH